MSQDTDLTAVIEAHLGDVEDIPDERHRQTENQEYEPDGRFSEAWMRITHKFGAEMLRTLPASGGRLDKMGFTQVDFYVPLKAGREVLDLMADRTRDAFPPQKNLAVNGRPLTITASRRWGGRRDGKWWTDNVDITWVLRAIRPVDPA